MFLSSFVKVLRRYVTAHIVKHAEEDTTRAVSVILSRTESSVVQTEPPLAMRRCAFLQHQEIGCLCADLGHVLGNVDIRQCMFMCEPLDVLCDDGSTVGRSKHALERMAHTPTDQMELIFRSVLLHDDSYAYLHDYCVSLIIGFATIS